MECVTRMTMRIAFVVSLIAAATTSGCGAKTIVPPRTSPVTGTVTLKNKPFAGVLVTFHPQFDIGPIKYTPSGETGSDGKFTLSTGAPGNGAPPGEYLVTFEKLRTVSDRQNSGIEKEVDDLKGKFSDPARSNWKVTISDGRNELEPFQLD